MGEKNGKFEGDINLPRGSFSRLLLSSSSPLSCDNDDVVDDKSFVNKSSVFISSPLFSSNTPKMLCFGDFSSKFTPPFTIHDEVSTNPITSNPNKRRNGLGKETGYGSVSGSENGQHHQKTGMKMKKNKQGVGPIVSSSPGHAKVRREKLGERINVLQQLVSPYGKTDTASVLHEAVGYIRFLHDQVKVLSMPYLNCSPSSSSSPNRSHSENGKHCTKANNDSIEGLRSRGICLVPVECIVGLAEHNGADFWAPTTYAISALAP